MGLKKALLSYTDKFGNYVSQTLTIKDVVFKYEDLRIEVIYRILPTDASKQELAENAFVSHSFPIDLSNGADIALVLSASDRIWELAMDSALIEVPEIQDGVRRVVRRSLLDVGATVEETK